MYHLVNVDHKNAALHLTRSTVNGFKKHYISSAVDGTDEDMLQSGSKRCECEEDEGTDCEDGDRDTDW